MAKTYDFEGKKYRKCHIGFSNGKSYGWGLVLESDNIKDYIEFYGKKRILQAIKLELAVMKQSQIKKILSSDSMTESEFRDIAGQLLAKNASRYAKNFELLQKDAEKIWSDKKKVKPDGTKIWTEYIKF